MMNSSGRTDEWARAEDENTEHLRAFSASMVGKLAGLATFLAVLASFLARCASF